MITLKISPSYSIFIFFPKYVLHSNRNFRIFQWNSAHDEDYMRKIKLPTIQSRFISCKFFVTTICHMHEQSYPFFTWEILKNLESFEPQSLILHHQG